MPALEKVAADVDAGNRFESKEVLHQRKTLKARSVQKSSDLQGRSRLNA
jgi:hypothetical protein